ncbi:MAG TPA: hypothetical protein VNO76_04540, partial [Thermoplasmata archaeon]|nr:hypothetical protein [Thermoplasmata archaeon]
MTETDGPAGLSDRLQDRLQDPLVKSVIGIVALIAVSSLILSALNDIGEISFTFMATYWTFLLQPAFTALEVTVISF